MQTEISGLDEEAEPVAGTRVTQGDAAYEGGVRVSPPSLQTLSLPGHRASQQGQLSSRFASAMRQTVQGWVRTKPSIYSGCPSRG